MDAAADRLFHRVLLSFNYFFNIKIIIKKLSHLPVPPSIHLFLMRQTPILPKIGLVLFAPNR